MDDDRVFWARVEDMPPWEAEQECVSRRERIALENAMLATEREKLMPLNSAEKRREHKALGNVIMDNSGQMTLLNERIRYLRKLQNKLQWRDAVLTLFGQDAFDQCVVWLEQQYGHMSATRREWAGK